MKTSIKKIIAIILPCIILLCSVFSTALAENLTNNSSTDTEEYIYYSDLFTAYHFYLGNNLPLIEYETETLTIIRNILDEYISSTPGKMAAMAHGINIATSPTNLMKEITDNVGLTNFKYNDELDRANQTLAEIICNISLNTANSISKENKYIKNTETFLTLAKDLEELAAENEAYYNGLSKPKLYKSFTDQTIAYLEDYFTRISPQLPSLGSNIYTTLCETTEILGTLTDAVDFATALALSLAMCETQLDLIGDIMSTVDSDSVLRKGLSRLYNQLSEGFLSYFSDTYIKDRVYDEVIGHLPEKASEWILGGWAKYGTVVTSIVRFLNTAIFDWVLGLDYYEYTTSVMLSKYASDLYDGLRTFSTPRPYYAPYFYYDNELYETIYKTYTAIKQSTLNECKKLAKHNSEYDNDNYIPSVSYIFKEGLNYSNYIKNVKNYIKAFPKENRQFSNDRSYEIWGDTVISPPSDTINEATIYLYNNTINGQVSVEYGTLTVPNCNVTITDSMTFQTNPVLHNKGNLTINGNIYSYIEAGSKIINDNSITVNGNIESFANDTQIIQNSDSATLKVSGDFNIASKENCRITNGTVFFNGTTQQTVNNLSAPTIVLENKSTEGVVFSSKITPTTLFNHNGNKFTLQNGGTFVDYDGDGLKDNVDPQPTVKAENSGNNSGESGGSTDNGDDNIEPDEDPDIQEDAIIHKNVLPENAIYKRNGAIIAQAGEAFPTPQQGDTYYYGNLEYRYNAQIQSETSMNPTWISAPALNGWGVVARDKALTEYGPILQSIGNVKVKSLYAAFANCVNMQSAPKIPNTITSKGLEYAFYGCTSLINAPVLNNNITSIVGTFKNCTNLKTVTIPNNVINMQSAFYGCTSLVNVEIPNSAKDLGSAFYNCSSLVSVNIPNNVISLNGAFSGCENLNIDDFVLNNVTDLNFAFNNCNALSCNIVINSNPVFTHSVFSNTKNPISLSGTCDKSSLLKIASGNNNISIK